MNESYIGVWETTDNVTACEVALGGKAINETEYFAPHGCHRKSIIPLCFSMRGYIIDAKDTKKFISHQKLIKFFLYR